MDDETLNRLIDEYEALPPSAITRFASEQRLCDALGHTVVIRDGKAYSTRVDPQSGYSYIVVFEGRVVERPKAKNPNPPKITIKPYDPDSPLNCLAGRRMD